MKKTKAFFYRIDAAEFVSALIQIPDVDRGKWATQFAIDLVSGVGNSDYARKVIQEVATYRENAAQSGKSGSLKRWDNKHLRMVKNG